MVAAYLIISPRCRRARSSTSPTNGGQTKGVLHEVLDIYIDNLPIMIREGDSQIPGHGFVSRSVFHPHSEKIGSQRNKPGLDNAAAGIQLCGPRTARINIGGQAIFQSADSRLIGLPENR